MSSSIRKEEIEEKEDEIEKMEEETEKRVRWRLRFHAGEQVAGEKMTTTIAIGTNVKKKGLIFV